MNTLFTLGPLTFTRYGFCTAGALAVTMLLMLMLTRGKASLEKRLGFCALCVIPAVVCGHLVFAAANAINYFSVWAKPSLILHLWDGGYSLAGALLGIILTAAVCEKLFGMEKGSLRNALALALPIGIALQRLNEAGTGLGVGMEAPAGWPAFLTTFDEATGMTVHAVYLYEAVAMLVLFLILLLWKTFSGERMPAGELLRLFCVLYGGIQIMLEAMRQDQHMVLHFVHISQVAALLFVLCPLIGWTVRYARYSKKKLAAVHWIVAVVGVGVAIAASFMIDRSEYKLVAWSLLLLGDLILIIDTLIFRVRANYVAGE